MAGTLLRHHFLLRRRSLKVEKPSGSSHFDGHFVRGHPALFGTSHDEAGAFLGSFVAGLVGKAPNVALADVTVRSAKAREKDYKLADSGGLYLLVTPAGGKLWRLKYRIHGVEKKLALGRYPEMSLSEARKARDAARELASAGQDPSAEKRRQSVAARLAIGTTFGDVALEYIE